MRKSKFTNKEIELIKARMLSNIKTKCICDEFSNENRTVTRQDIYYIRKNKMSG